MRREQREQLYFRAALYGLLLRARGFPADEAAARVIERYPAARPYLEKTSRGAVVDPLQPEPTREDRSA